MRKRMCGVATCRLPASLGVDKISFSVEASFQMVVSVLITVGSPRLSRRTGTIIVLRVLFRS